MRRQQTPRDVVIISTAGICRDNGDIEARRQNLRAPQSLRFKMKTFGFSNFLLFHLGPRDLFWCRDDLQDDRDLVLQGQSKQEAGDCLLKPWFQHLPCRRTPQEAAEASMRVYGMLADLCLWPKLRVSLSSRGGVVSLSLSVSDVRDSYLNYRD